MPLLEAVGLPRITLACPVATRSSRGAAQEQAGSSSPPLPQPLEPFGVLPGARASWSARLVSRDAIDDDDTVNAGNITWSMCTEEEYQSSSAYAVASMDNSWYQQSPQLALQLELMCSQPPECMHVVDTGARTPTHPYVVACDVPWHARVPSRAFAHLLSHARARAATIAKASRGSTRSLPNHC